MLCSGANPCIQAACSSRSTWALRCCLRARRGCTQRWTANRSESDGKVLLRGQVAVVEAATDLPKELVHMHLSPLSLRYLAVQLAAGLLAARQADEEEEAILRAGELLTLLSIVVSELVCLPRGAQLGLLDGLMDLSPPSPNECLGRYSRRRLHQALNNMVRFFLHHPALHLEGAAAAVAASDRRWAAALVQRRRDLRTMSQRQVPSSTVAPQGQNAVAGEACPDAAFVHGLKQWNVNFHEWSARAAAWYFLQDDDVREGWIGSGRRESRSRTTLLTQELRDRRAEMQCVGVADSKSPLTLPDWCEFLRKTAEEVLPPVGTRLKLLDVGSCGNYFGLHHSERFDTTAVDLKPFDSSVLACDILKVSIGPPGSDRQFEQVKSNNGRESTSFLCRMPEEEFDVVVLALLLSVLPGPEARATAILKIRRLLRRQAGRGLLIIGDTAGTVGRHSDPEARGSPWVQAVEAAGFTLLRDPQMHLSRVWERGAGCGLAGFANRAFCWCFVTAGRAPTSAMPLPLMSEMRQRRPPGDGRLKAQAARAAVKAAREARKVQKLEDLASDASQKLL